MENTAAATPCRERFPAKQESLPRWRTGVRWVVTIQRRTDRTRRQGAVHDAGADPRRLPDATPLRAAVHGVADVSGEAGAGGGVSGSHGRAPATCARPMRDRPIVHAPGQSV